MSNRAALNPYFKTYYTPNGVSNPCACTPPAIPLSKSSTTNLNTSTNTTQISSKMRCAQLVQTYGTTQPSTSYVKKTCSLGGPTFSY